MAIKVPGKRNRRGKLSAGNRSAVFTLSLTAMVDMFTVLVVFLLQNYKVTGEALPMRSEIQLPQASAVKELKPANVVIVGKDFIEVNKLKVASLLDVVESEQWLITDLKASIESAIANETKKRSENLAEQIRVALVQQNDPNYRAQAPVNQVTLQADESVPILALKKIMYTITEGGGGAINFAVIKKEKSDI